ncbi:MAG: hypothetical protein AAFR18_12975 [Cyanobacteria bacterium J06627_32]
MTIKTQLVLPGLPKQKGGVRPGAGRKKTGIPTTTLRVAEAVAFDCKRIDEDFRKGQYAIHSGRVIVATPVHGGTLPWLRKYAEEMGLSVNEAASELLASALANLFPETLE